MDGEISNPSDSELVANLGWVQRLALSLARDRDAADDLAQDVARVWLEKRPALADGPRGWLASVARKLTLDRARSESARKAREHRTARPESESFEVVERGARQRRVVEAVMQLAEPYRSTILYRYLDGLETHEVATRMGVPEATVRKRVERGLAILRERLDREFGSRSSAWAIALLEPGLHSAVFKGVGLMNLKWLAAAGVVVLLAGAAWYVRGIPGSGVNKSVGGTGVVVPMQVAVEREQQLTVDVPGLENPVEARRASEAAPPAPRAPELHGSIFVDDEHSAPADLKITRNRNKTEADAAVHVDAATASWSLDTLVGEPAQLWITSSSTMPALIPVPRELWANGGVFDLHLSKGRTLALTFLERGTKQTLPNLEFQISRSIGEGRGLTGGNQTVHRTDAHGQVRVTGIPLTGQISVRVDFATRDRDVVLRGNSPMRWQMQRTPDWSTWLEQEQPANLEETILVSLPLGEGCAGGQVPAWAVALVGETESVRVIACETTNETSWGRGMPFLLEQDELGHFELCENAPSTHVVWLEQARSGERISAETEVNFAQAGPQDPISFRALQGIKLTLNFINVPGRGQIQARIVDIVGKSSATPAVTLDCKGAPLSRVFTLTEDEQIRLTLRLGANAHDKSCWTRMLKVDAQREITVDLAGSERSVRLECPECGPLGEEGTIGLMRCEAGQVELDQTIVVLCSVGRGITSVHVPSGRWLYRYEDKNHSAIWGAVDVRSASEPGEELVLHPRIRLAAAAEFGAGVRFDEIDGISLAKLPEELRTSSVKAPGERIAVPIDAKYAALEAKK